MNIFTHPIDLAPLELVLNYQFKDKNLLYLALSHRSFANENESCASHNERLEFIGDSILGFIITEHLYINFPNFSEGELSSLRARLICKETLAEIARNLDLGRFILLGRGEMNSGGQSRDSLLSDTFEAVIAAVFLDGGLDPIKAIVLRLFYNHMFVDTYKKPLKEYKNILQEFTQSHFQSSPYYEIVSAIGPDHAKWYEIKVVINNETKGCGRGPSKKEAEKNAAKEACQNLKIDTE